MRCILAGVVLTLMLTSGAGAGPLEDGERASRAGDYATALRLWRPLAEQDDADAQNNLGLMYRNGQGVPQDYVEAVKWYASPPSRAMPMGSSCSAQVTSSVRACRRTTCRHICGSILPPLMETLWRLKPVIGLLLV